MRKPVYRVLVADPPWPFRDKLPGNGRGAAKHYDLLSMKRIVRFLADDVSLQVSERGAILFLWMVPSMAREALAVCEGWGFEPKSELIWVKLPRGAPEPEFPDQTPRNSELLHFGMGRYARMAHERCIIAARGKVSHLLGSRNTRSVFFAPVGKHSAKPDAFYRIVEKLVPGGPYLELFARRRREGWTTLGNQVDGGTGEER